MLQSISIRNYAIIDELEINFESGLNIMTGETGAGKSIILGALGLVLGERADSKVLFDTSAKCLVEATFNVDTNSLKTALESNDLDYESNTVLRREINAAGKSRAFINDTPVSLQLLKSIGALLVNLHSQHETLSLMEAGFQLNTVDIFAGNNNLFIEYQPLFFQYKKHIAKLAALEKQQLNANTENDYLLFQLNELREANLQQDEQQQLEEELSTLSNAESIKTALQKSYSLMDENEISVTSLLSEISTELKSVQQFSSHLSSLHERLQTLLIEIKDIVRDTEKLNDDISVQPERLMEVNERLMLLHRLCKKHQALNADELISVMEQLEEKAGKGATIEREIEELKLTVSKEEVQLLKLAETLHKNRDKTSTGISKTVAELLKKVGMPEGSFAVVIKHTTQKQLNDFGFSEVEFLFSANKGIAPQALKNVASGGELSRLMLCIKSLLADAGELPTMIFDEIDTGISGEVAQRVGLLMKDLSKHHQLICITHLPQIATSGNTHFFIYKDNSKGITRTRIRKLSGEERVVEIAKMLSGDKLTDAAIANAKALIAN
jgi:DNA repair protein RecN (Recombination protein N)